MKKAAIVFAAVALAVALSPSPEAEGVFFHDLRTLLAQSEIVAVGTVQIQSIEGSRVVVRVQPDRLLLGPPEAAQGFTAYYEADEPDFESAMSSARGLVFASASRSGWSLMPRRDSPLVVADTVVRLPEVALAELSQYPETAPLIDKVASVIWQAALGSDHTLSDEALFVLSPLLTAHCEETPAELDCAHFFSASKGHQSDCPYFKILEAWQYTFLEKVERFLDANSADRLPATYLGLLMSVRSPGVVPALERLLARAPAGSVLEHHVATGLVRIHSPSTLPIFAGLLDRPERVLQYKGVSGFCQFANNVVFGRMHHPRLGGGASTPQTMAHCPSLPKFMEDPDRYVQFWKSWYPDHGPAVSISGGGASCHPRGPGGPCTVPLTATASDSDGDPIYYQWSGCSASAEASAQCKVNKLGPVGATVTVNDGRGGTAIATTTVTGVNQKPAIFCKRWYPTGRLPAGSEATLEFGVVDDDTTASADCRVDRVFRNCTQTGFSCVGKSGLVNVQIGESRHGTKLCSVEVTWHDRWGARATATCSIDTE